MKTQGPARLSPAPPRAFAKLPTVKQIPPSAWLAAAASAVLQVIIFPGLFWYVLCWVALAPLFIALMGGPFLGPRVVGEKPDVVITPLQGFLLGYFAGIIWYAGSCNWIFHVMNSYGGLSQPVAAGVLVLFSLYLGLYHGLFGLLLAWIFVRRGVRRALFAAPFLWVAVELARALVTGFPWDPLGTVQVSNIPLTGMATVTGVYGISWVIALVNAGFTAAVVLPPERRRTLLAATIVAALALQAGAFVQPPPSPATHEAALLQENIPIERGWNRARLEQTLAELSALSSNPPTPPDPGGEAVEPLIIWPESPAPFFEVDPGFRHWLSALAIATHANIITGVVGMRVGAHQQVQDTFNSAILVQPGGDFVARYDKVHLVPWGEYVPFKSVFSFARSLTHEVGDFSRGAERTVFTLHGRDFSDEKVGVFICYESIFPDEIRLFVLNGAQLLVNISNDGWFGESGAPGQHLNMARMRAIENRRWVLRSTNTGITASIDPYGRVVSSEPRNIRGSLRARFAFAADTTFYTRHGDWFAWLCAIISLLALLLPGELALTARPLRVRETVVAGNG